MRDASSSEEEGVGQLISDAHSVQCPAHDVYSEFVTFVFENLFFQSHFLKDHALYCLFFSFMLQIIQYPVIVMCI